MVLRLRENIFLSEPSHHFLYYHRCPPYFLTVQSLSTLAARMAHDNENSDTTIFMPHDMLGGLSEYFDCIPHYLFRTSSPQSRGATTKTFIASAAVKHHLNQSDILGRYWEEAVEMLKSHLLWQNRTDDNLMSWTNSFLFAAQHARLYVERQLIGQLPHQSPYTSQFWILETSVEEHSYPLLLYFKRTTLKVRANCDTITTTANICHRAGYPVTRL